METLLKIVACLQCRSLNSTVKTCFWLPITSAADTSQLRSPWVISEFQSIVLYTDCSSFLSWKTKSNCCLLLSFCAVIPCVQSLQCHVLDEHSWAGSGGGDICVFFDVFIMINMPSGQCSEILGRKVSSWASLWRQQILFQGSRAVIFEQVDIWSLESVVFQDHEPQTQMCMCSSLEKEVWICEDGEGVIRSGRNDQSWGPHTGTHVAGWVVSGHTPRGWVGWNISRSYFITLTSFLLCRWLLLGLLSFPEQLQVPVFIRHFVYKRAQRSVARFPELKVRKVRFERLTLPV